MNPKRIRLVNAARKALFQRAQVQRAVGDVRTNFAPQALKQRAKGIVVQRVDNVVSSAERGLRRYAVPLGAAALAGLAFAFRRPLANAAHVIADHVTDAAAALKAQYDAASETPSASPSDQKDHDDEPV